MSKPINSTHIRSLARSYTTQALLTLAGIMEHGVSEANRIKASNALLMWGYGRPVQLSENTGEAVAIRRVVHEIVFPKSQQLPMIEGECQDVIEGEKEKEDVSET